MTGWHDRVYKFRSSHDAAVTAEFVVIFPLVLALLFLIVFISMYIAAASDLQQVVHDLARYSYRYSGQAASNDLCASLRTQAVPVLVEATFMLKPDSFTLVSCSAPQGPDRVVTITATYDFAGSFVQSLGRTFGLSVGIISRQSVFIP